MSGFGSGSIDLCEWADIDGPRGRPSINDAFGSIAAAVRSVFGSSQTPVCLHQVQPSGPDTPTIVSKSVNQSKWTHSDEIPWFRALPFVRSSSPASTGNRATTHPQRFRRSSPHFQYNVRVLDQSTIDKQNKTIQPASRNQSKKERRRWREWKRSGQPKPLHRRLERRCTA